MKHDTVVVHAFQTVILEHLKQSIVNLKYVIYFSDGAVSHYKNYKNFANLLNHSTDHGLHAEWNFFGTSHGKNTCDGIGGTVKRLAARASLQHTYKDHILTSKQLFDFCLKNIAGMKFFFVPSSKVDEHHCLLQERLESHSTVPGTRHNHWFVPLSKTELKIGKVSGDDASWIYCTTAKCKSSASGETEYKFEVGQYVACLYDQKWYIGIALQDGEEDDEFQVKFMLPNGPSNYFQWPCKDDVCWVPKSHLLCTISAPTTTSLGRQYQISQDTTSLVSTLAETRQRRLQQKS